MEIPLLLIRHHLDDEEEQEEEQQRHIEAVNNRIGQEPMEEGACKGAVTQKSIPISVNRGEARAR